MAGHPHPGKDRRPSRADGGAALPHRRRSAPPARRVLRLRLRPGRLSACGDNEKKDTGDHEAHSLRPLGGRAGCGPDRAYPRVGKHAREPHRPDGHRAENQRRHSPGRRDEPLFLPAHRHGGSLPAGHVPAGGPPYVLSVSILVPPAQAGHRPGGRPPLFHLLGNPRGCDAPTCTAAWRRRESQRQTGSGQAFSP